MLAKEESSRKLVSFFFIVLFWFLVMVLMQEPFFQRPITYTEYLVTLYVKSFSNNNRGGVRGFDHSWAKEKGQGNK
jgi:hypothetical protein